MLLFAGFYGNTSFHLLTINSTDYIPMLQRQRGTSFLRPIGSAEPHFGTKWSSNCILISKARFDCSNTNISRIFGRYWCEMECYLCLGRWSHCGGIRTGGTRTSNLNSEVLLQPLKRNKFVINKSRYASIDCFISRNRTMKPEYNDINLVYDKEVYQQLVDGGVDELLARHIAHLFIRDPLVIYRNRLAIDDERESDHFEV